MEEQKEKVVEMQPTTKETERPEKMSYEQLENIAHQLSEQAKQLYMKLQAANMGNMFKRLDYLFKVVELSLIHISILLIQMLNSLVTLLPFLIYCQEEIKKSNYHF